MSIKKVIHTCCPPFLRPILAKIEASDIGYRLARGTFWSLTGAVISRGLMLVASILVARILGKTGFGELGMIQSTVGMFGVFAGFGLGITATNYVAEYRRSDPARAGRIIGISGLVAIVSGGVMALALYLFAPWLSIHTINAPQLSGILRIGSIILFISAINGAQTGALAGFEAFKTVALVNLLVGLVSFPILISGAYFGGRTGAVWALSLNLCVNWFINHIALRKVARQHSVPITYRECNREMPMLWKFSLPVALSGFLVGPIIWIANSILVNKPDGYAQLGLYTAASQLYLPLLMLTTILANVYVPILSNSYVSESQAQFRKHARRMVATNGFGLLFFALLFLCLYPLLQPIYGRDYDFRFTLIFLITFVSTLRAFGSYLNAILVAMRMPYYGLAGNALWAVVYVGLFLYCSRYGAIGMAFSSLVSLFVSQVLIEYYMLQKIFDKNGNIFVTVFKRILRLGRTAVRKNHLEMTTTTAFFRNIPQLNTIVETAPAPQNIHVFACSKGCEAYALAMLYHKQNRGIVPRILGFDVDKPCIDKARAGVYTPVELLYGANRTFEAQVRNYLDQYLLRRDDGCYQVFEEIRLRCSFETGSILDANFMRTLGKADIVVCQNVLVHMTVAENRNAMESLVNTVRPGGLLVIGGMRVSVRERIVKEMGLVAVTANCREIHEAQMDLRQLWDNRFFFNRPYFAMPPYVAGRDSDNRYGTIFRLPESVMPGQITGKV